MLALAAATLLSTPLALPPQDPAPPAEPPLLTCLDGTPCETAAQWRDVRRPEILDLFEQHVYGRTPDLPAFRTEILDQRPAFDGRARRTRLAVTFRGNGLERPTELLVFQPADQLDAPLFLGLNFRGNHTVVTDPDIPVPVATEEGPKGAGLPAPVEQRGSRKKRYPIGMLLDRGFGFATAWYGDLDPDFHDGFANGLHPLLGVGSSEAPRAADAPGSIAIWAIGLSCYRRALRVVGTETVAVFGHSRLGKTALWAGAIDEGFALTISNNSGCGGAALSKRKKGETVARITTTFPHWFCPRFAEYGGREEALPLDQHMLIALMAPRHVHVASASEDAWADPEGEWLATRDAATAWIAPGLHSTTQITPPRNEADTYGAPQHHLRTGNHNLLAEDWAQYARTANKLQH